MPRMSFEPSVRAVDESTRLSAATVFSEFQYFICICILSCVGGKRDENNGFCFKRLDLLALRLQILLITLITAPSVIYSI
jgi:hypothetical protein